FHVFAVYPWVGMLRAGYAEEPLRVLNSCRVRWGTVLGLDGVGGATVRSRPLCWDGRALALGVPLDERVRVDLDRSVRPGDTVTLHWDWLCDTVSPSQHAQLRRYTA